MSVLFIQMWLLFHAIKLLKLITKTNADVLVHVLYFASDWLTAEFETDLNSDHLISIQVFRMSITISFQNTKWQISGLHSTHHMYQVNNDYVETKQKYFGLQQLYRS